MNIKRMMVYGVYYCLYLTGFYLLCIHLKEYFNSSVWKEAASLIALWFVVIRPAMNYIENKIDKHTLDD